MFPVFVIDVLKQITDLVASGKMSWISHAADLEQRNSAMKGAIKDLMRGLYSEGISHFSKRVVLSARVPERPC